MTQQDILQQLETALPEITFSLQGDGCQLSVTAIGDCFAGKRKVQRQQLIHQVLQTAITSGAIHALSIHAFTPDEYEAQ